MQMGVSTRGAHRKPLAPRAAAEEDVKAALAEHPTSCARLKDSRSLPTPHPPSLGPALSSPTQTVSHAAARSRRRALRSDTAVHVPLCTIPLLL